MTSDYSSGQHRSRCLVTGSTGFIGRNLVASLLQLDFDVRVLRRAPRHSGSNRFPVVDVIADLSDHDTLARSMQGVEVVYHFAGVGSPSSLPEQYPEIIDTNVTGTLNVLTAAADAGVRRVVVASSGSVYGRLSSPALSEDMVPEPASLYAISKLSAEHMCAMVHQSRGIETIALRYFNVYGPDEDPEGQSSKLIPSILRRLQAHQQIMLFGDGHQTRDFVHIDDVVAATISAGTVSGVSHLVANIGSGQATRVSDVVHLLSSSVDTRSPLLHKPERPYEIRHSVANIGRAREVLGFRPSISFPDAIETLVRGSSYAAHRGYSEARTG